MPSPLLLRFPVLLLVGVSLLSSSCRRRAALTAPLQRPLSLTQLRAEHTRAERDGDLVTSIEVAEAIKCRELSDRLLRAGVTSSIIPLTNRIPLPPLATNDGVLVFFQAQDRLYRYLVRQGKVVTRPPIPRSEIEPLFTAARDELELGDDLHGQELFSRLRRVYTRLIGDLEGELVGVRRLLVLPDGLARFVPFHALVVPETLPADPGQAPVVPVAPPADPGKAPVVPVAPPADPSKAPVVPEAPPSAPRFFIQSVDLSYAPCLAVAQGPAWPVHRVEILAPTYRARSELDGARIEAEQLKDFFGAKATLFVGTQATGDRLLHALHRSSGLVHFAGHGVTDLEPGGTPTLVLPEPAAGLTLAAATAEPVRASLVVLGSCATAYAARFRQGERRLAEPNFPEALLGAGAGAVVAASWAVKDLQSVEQLSVFYRELEARGAAGALAEAQRQAISRIRPPHPRFWAFYALYGGWR